MPDRVLQNHNCVAALQQPPLYNVIMSLPASKQGDEKQSGEPAAPARGAAGPRRARARFCRAGLAVVTLLVTGVLAAGCGGGSSVKPVAGFADASFADRALSFVNCMRTHGEPDMPEPVVNGNSVHITIKAGSGIDPGSPRYNAAFKACKHLASPGKGSAPGGPTITPADQADYLKAVACMRSHGYPKFPDPVFQNNNVTFNSTTPIDTHTSQYQRALVTCDKLIPAGLPYSGRSPSAS